MQKYFKQYYDGHVKVAHSFCNENLGQGESLHLFIFSSLRYLFYLCIPSKKFSFSNKSGHSESKASHPCLLKNIDYTKYSHDLFY